MKLPWQRREEELDEEIRGHLRMAARDRVGRGETPEQAEAGARREFGNVALVKEVTRGMWGGAWLRQITQDLRYGLRMMRRGPLFSAVAVLTLAFGVGANTAIFSVVNAVLLQPLPYPEPDQLVQLWESRPRQNMPQTVSAPHEFLAWAEQGQSFQQLAASDLVSYNLTERGEPERLSTARVTASYFPLFGVAPALGRAFLPAEDQPGQNNVVVLGHDLWQNRFGADPSIINQTVSLDGVPCTVVGVMPRGFRLPQDARLARPIAFGPEDRVRAGNHFLNVYGRLQPGITLRHAEAEMAAITARLEQTFAPANAGHQLVLTPLREQLVGDVRPALLVLLGAVGLVLLIACANLANLLLARAEARRKEVAVRAALGASRWRIVRQLLAESVLLAAAGGAAGLFLAAWGVDLLVSLDPEGVRRVGEVRLDAVVFAFALALSLATGLLFGLAPALQASKTDLVETLKEGGRAGGGGKSGGRLRSLLVASEVALTLVLLVGAGLLVKSFARLLDVDPGLDPRAVLTLDVSLPPAKYAEAPQVTAFYDQLLEEVTALPGVETVGAVSVLPLTGSDNSNFVHLEGRPPLPPGQTLRAGRRNVTPDYFRAFRIPLKAGRLIAPSDDAQAPRVAVINEAMARAFFEGQDPLGRRLRTGGDNPWITVVGVVGDVRHRGLDLETRPEMFFPHAQAPSRQMTLAVRTEGDPLALVGGVRDRVRAVDAEQPVGNVKTMEAWLAESVASRRFAVLLLGAFALAAALLAALGIYGVVAYGVERRTHELGLRIALGARRADVLLLVIRQGMKATALGAALGLAAAFGLTRLMASLLYGVSATDPMVFAGVSVLLLAVALAACYLPARRAAKVDPLTALRYE